MDILRFITCGSVDDGKSTLIGRLLYDSNSVSLDILEAIERQTKHKAEGEIDLALLTDGLRAEREQGITIDVAYKYFTTAKRKFIIADTPGHVQYTRNMVTGASNADLAIVLIDARQGVIEQTRRHSIIAALLGIPRLVVAINKMDLVGYDASTYENIVADYQAFAQKLRLKDVVFMPISALNGDNIVEPSAQLPWYQGPTLLHYLETVAVDIHQDERPRFQVQYVIRPQSEAYHDYRGYAGKIQSGRYAVGDSVTVLPSGIESHISAIEVNLKSVAVAESGQAAVLHLADDIDISRGDSIVASDALPQVSNELEAVVCWMDEKTPLQKGARYLLRHNAALVKVVVKEVIHKIDIETSDPVATEQAKLNDLVKIQLKTAVPLAFDNYADNRTTGAFILIHEQTGNTVAAGMIETA